MFTIVVAFTIKDRGIGKAGSLPWVITPDLKRFKTLTMDGVVIMGRRTWDSIPETRRPLRNRVNIVLTTQPKQITDIDHIDQVCSTLDEALLYTKRWFPQCKVFVIGGGQVYTEAVHHPECGQIFVTEIVQNIECDTFFPKIPRYFEKCDESTIEQFNGIQYRYVSYVKSNK
jgi:dihydrofolate reductase